MEHHTPKLFYVKLVKHYEHQGAKKKAMRIITTHDPRVLPEYLTKRGWQPARAMNDAPRPEQVQVTREQLILAGLIKLPAKI